jgi:hypothetical protein
MKNKTNKVQPEKYIREDDPDLKNSQELIDYLAEAYRDTGDMSYRDCLLECFEGYLLKYVSLLAHHNNGVDINNKDTKNFLRLFMTKEERLNQHTYEKYAGTIVHKVRRALRLFTPGDVYNELVVYFLELLEKWKPKKILLKGRRQQISFAHYIQVNIRYRLWHWVARKGRDVLTGRECVEYHEWLHEKEPNYDNDPPGVGVGINLEGWVWGQEAGEIFSGLTEAERYLLWLKYEGNPGGRLTMKDLASMMGLHYQTIVYRMEKIKKKLKTAMEEVK